MALSAESFINLSKKDAQNLAEINNLIFRLLSVNGEPMLSYPQDKREDRICVEIENSRVTKAFIC